MKSKSRRFKKIFALVLAATLCVTGILPGEAVKAAESSAEENPFADVKENAWYYQFVQFVYEKGIMGGKGLTDGKVIFDPNASITRAEFVQILYTNEGKPEVEYDDVFSDVPEGKWYTNPIMWAYEEGIAAGNGTTFDVSLPITRQEMATMLRKYAESKGYNTSQRADISGYSDCSKVSPWAVDNMKWAIAYEIMGGTADNRIAPLEYASRAQAATMIRNLFLAYESEDGGDEDETPTEEYGVVQNADGSVTIWVLSEDSTTPITVYYVLNNTNPTLSQTVGMNMTKNTSVGEHYYSATLTGLNYATGDTLTYLIGYVPLGTEQRMDTPFMTVTLGDDSDEDKDTEVALTGLTMNQTTADLKVGGTAKLTVSYIPSNTTQTAVTWKSSDTTVATVDGGTVTAKNAGTAVITATSVSNSKVSVSCTVTVEAADSGETPVTPSAEYGVTENADGSLTFWVQAEDRGIATTVYYVLNRPSATLGDMVGVNLTADAAMGENYFSVTVSNLSYQAGDTLRYMFGYVPVGQSGRVDSPYVNVTLGTAGGGDEDTEVAVTALSLNKTTASVKVDSSVKLTAVYTPSNTTQKGVTWKSSDETVATVEDGKVTAVAVGTAVITATSTVNTSLTASCTVTVVPASENDEPEAKEDQMYFYFKNETAGEYSDAEVYWCILGKDPETKELCYVNTEGELVPATPALNTISKGDRKCADIFFTLEEKDFVYMPNIESGRMYFSYGSPVYVTINTADDGTIGFAGPDLNNTSDPNQDVLFEFIEFTIIDGVYWGNTTRVDFFSFPIVTTLKGEGGFVNTPGDADVFEKTVGDIGTRAEIFAAFEEEVPTEYKTLVQDLRIMAPCKATFNEKETYANYFDAYIDSIYEEYKDKDLVFTCQAGTFRGRTSSDGTQMIFNQDGGETGLVVKKPTTQEAFEGKGALATGSTMELVVQAQFCAAINRGVAHLTDSQWDDSTQFYKNGTANYYADFFHRHSLHGLAYGFCYDDVYDYSTLLHYTKPTGLTIELKW